ncbi:MAG: TonB-dependent receptor, partial [Gimesia chilikensis]
MQYARFFDSGNELVIRNSVSRFDRELRVPGFDFSGIQTSSFSEAHLLGSADDMDWVVGINLLTEDFEQQNPLPGFAHDHNSHTMGVFTQGTMPITTDWTIEAGLRIDGTSSYGNFVLPRLALLYTPEPETTLRIGGGLGYKEPTLFTEESESRQFQAVLPLQAQLLQAEESAGLNMDINRVFDLSADLTLNLNLLLFYTRVDNPLRLAANGQEQFAFQQSREYLDTRGTEINAVWNWENLKLFLGYTHANVQERDGGAATEALLMPQNRLNTVLVYEREDDIRIGLEAYY